MTSFSKNDCSNPPGGLICLKFRHNVCKGQKKEVRNFGHSRRKGFRVVAASLIEWAKRTPLLPICSTVNEALGKQFGEVSQHRELSPSSVLSKNVE